MPEDLGGSQLGYKCSHNCVKITLNLQSGYAGIIRDHRSDSLRAQANIEQIVKAVKFKDDLVAAEQLLSAFHLVDLLSNT